jgi:serine protease Do
VDTHLGVRRAKRFRFPEHALTYLMRLSMRSSRSRPAFGALLSLALAFLWVGQDPFAGEARKGEPRAGASDQLPLVFGKEQPESIDDLKAIETQVQSVLAKIMPAVVGVRVGPAQGSGAIVTADGYVLTAGHVIGEPDRKAEVTLPDGRKLKAKTLGHNLGIDSGMVKIEGDQEWPHVEMGKSADVKKGQWVLAIGHPRGFNANRSPVVRVGRVLLVNPMFIQTDCPLVNGDSGGPLFDMTGKVIGINSRIGPKITENMHVPVDTYRQTWDRLAKGEKWGIKLGTPVLVKSPGGKVVYEKEGRLTAEDSTDAKQQGSFAQVHLFKMSPGFAYTIDMTSPNQKKLDPYLRLEDSKGNQIAEDDDGGGMLNARIVFRPAREDEYRIIATTFEEEQTGPYKLVIRQAEVKLALHSGKVDVLPAVKLPKPFAPLLVEKASQAGLALFASGTLTDAKGKPVSGKALQFRWEEGGSKVKTDDNGMIKLELSKANVRRLFLEVPEGLKVGLELTDKAGNPFPLPLPPDFEKEKVKSAGGKLVLQEEGQLTTKEPFDKVRKECFYKVHTFKMVPGSTYTLDLESIDFDSYLRLEDPAGKQLAEDDDSAGKLNSRIVFTPEKEAVYRLIVTTCDPDQYGNYRLSIYQTEAKKTSPPDRRDSGRS